MQQRSLSDINTAQFNQLIRTSRTTNQNIIKATCSENKSLWDDVSGRGSSGNRLCFFFSVWDHFTHAGRRGEKKEEERRGGERRERRDRRTETKSLNKAGETPDLDGGSSSSSRLTLTDQTPARKCPILQEPGKWKAARTLMSSSKLWVRMVYLIFMMVSTVFNGKKLFLK